MFVYIFHLEFKFRILLPRWFYYINNTIDNTNHIDK